MSTSYYNKFSSDILDAKTKWKGLVDKSDTFNLVTISDLYAKISTLSTKPELKAEQDKIVKLKTYDLSYFLDKNVSGDIDSQNMFVSQLNLGLYSYKIINYVGGWKSKGVDSFILSLPCTVFFV